MFRFDGNFIIDEVVIESYFGGIFAVVAVVDAVEEIEKIDKNLSIRE